MNAPDISQILAFLVVITVIALAITDHPSVLRVRGLRFLYRSGLLLYARTFKVRSQASKSSIPRWKIEHWMVASGFSSPRAEDDGEGRYLLAEFVSPLLLTPFPLLMRAKISWDNQEKDVIVRGYSTWSYFSVLAFLVVGLLVSSRVDGNLCIGALLFVYLIGCIMIYLHQAPHLSSIGVKVAEYLSSDGEQRNGEEKAG